MASVVAIGVGVAAAAFLVLYQVMRIVADPQLILFPRDAQDWSPCDDIEGQPVL
jgi:hypothetical protein